MQREFKQLDQQLELNHLARLPDPIPKPANSFFRALAISLFSTHHQSDFVRSIMKQTLVANCEAYEDTLLKKKRKYHIAFPIISQSSELVKKYVNDKQMLQTYLHSPDLDCFQNDNYELAAFTFNKRVSVYYLNREGYLNQTLISCCRNKTGRKIMLCKVGRRFFAVDKEAIRSVGVYIREYLLGNMITQIVLQKSDKQNTKVHFSAYDQIVISPHKKYPKIHKKSLSQCGDIINKLQQYRGGYVEQIEESFDSKMDKNFCTKVKNNFDQVENRSHQEEPMGRVEREMDFEEKGQLLIVETESSQLKTEVVQEEGRTVQIDSEQIQDQQKPQQSQLGTTTAQESSPQPATQQQPPSAQYPYQQQPQYTEQYTSQMQAYYQAPYMYSNYPGYDSQAYYANFYNMQQQMMYDPHYYSYYQQQQQPQTQGQEPYTYPQAQEGYAYTQPQQSYTYSQPQQLVNNKRYTGRLKFYDTNGKYGFIIVDGIGNDLFVHYDDLSKAGMTKEHLETHSASRELRFQFTYYEYEGRNKKAKKAIDLVPAQL